MILYYVTDPDALDYPLTHARIGYQTITRTGTVSASSSVDGYPSDAPKRPDTYERWKPSLLPATWSVDAGSAVAVDYIGIAAHTLGTSGATVQVQYSDNNTDWTNYGSDFIPADNSPVMVIGNEVIHRYWRLSISGATAPEVGVIYIGKALAMQRAIYGGHSPITLSRVTDIRPKKSEGGQFISKYILRQGVATSAQFQNITPSWYREYFDPFVLSARIYPFFFAWRPEKYPNEVAYAWTSKDITPTNSGTGKGWMNVSFSMEGFADAE